MQSNDNTDSAPPPLSFDDVARFPRPGMATPGTYRFRHDGNVIAFLASAADGLARTLWTYDPATGQRTEIARAPGSLDESELSLEERLRRERLRMRDVGITSYAWEPGGARILVPLSGALYVLDAPGEELREVVGRTDHASLDARFAPDGKSIAFVRDAEVCVVPTVGGQVTEVTSGARGTGRTNGLAEFVAQEEMGRMRGFWWSPDGARIAFQETDETHIPVYRIIHQGSDAVGDSAQEDHRYPFAGAANARVRLGVAAADGSGETVWMDLGADEDIYLARVGWFPDGSLAAQILDRRQSELRLLRFDATTGVATELLCETSDVWINLHDCFSPLLATDGPLAGGFVWASERTGFRHLELRAADGSLVRVLTEGEWMVDTLEHVDEDAEVLYFSGTRDGAIQRHVYAVSFTGGEPRRITNKHGTYTVRLAPDATSFVAMHHCTHRPPNVTLRSTADGEILATLHDERDPRIDELALEGPELLTIRSRDGATLHGALYKPAGEGPWPALMSVYGGPHAQRVTDGWTMTVDMRAQALARRGYVVFVVDNRGSARRGLAFEGALRHDTGAIEVRDQVDAANWLVEQGLADRERVGIYGWSYGGYMAAICLAKEPDVFRAAVSGAPVTHWDGYDTCYTERYMGLPQENAEGYERSSVMAHVDTLRGRLMLVHGLIDENVHFRHTARLVNELIRKRKVYELLLFPNERHMPRGHADRVYMEERIQAFLDSALS